MHRHREAGQVLLHQTSAPPPKLKKERKKELAAKATDRPKTIWISRRKPPEVSPKARVRPVITMMITQITLATGPCTRSEAHTSDLQSLMRLSYAAFCLNTYTPPLPKIF